MIDVSSISVRRLTAASLARSSAARSSRRLVAVVLDLQHADQPGQRQPLHQQRHQDDRERDDDDDRPVRERLPVGQRHRQRQRQRQRHDAAHPRPGDERHVLPGGVGIARAQAPAQQARHVGSDRDVDQPHQDGDAADHGAVERERGPRHVGGELTDRRELQPDQDEHQAVEQQQQHAPHAFAAEPRQRGQQLAGCASRGSRRRRRWRARPTRAGARPGCTPRRASAG